MQIRMRKEDDMEVKRLTADYDAAVAALIRRNLEAYHLDIPGTAYFDTALDHLSAYYDQPGRTYHVLLEDGTVIGSVGLAPFDGFEDCCELQKLYLDDAVKGRGLGHWLLGYIESRGREIGYRQVYLETHHVLQPAIHLYEKDGFKTIDRPESIVHSAMDRFFLKEL